MEKQPITPSTAADLNAYYLHTAINGEEKIRANNEEKERLIQQIGEDMLAGLEGEYDPTNAAELVRQAAALEAESVELGYQVKSVDAKARTLYEHREGNAALQDAALAEAALAGVNINV